MAPWGSDGRGWIDRCVSKIGRDRNLGNFENRYVVKARSEIVMGREVKTVARRCNALEMNPGGYSWSKNDHLGLTFAIELDIWSRTQSGTPPEVTRDHQHGPVQDQ